MGATGPFPSLFIKSIFASSYYVQRHMPSDSNALLLEEPGRSFTSLSNNKQKEKVQESPTHTPMTSQAPSPSRSTRWSGLFFFPPNLLTVHKNANFQCPLPLKKWYPRYKKDKKRQNPVLRFHRHIISRHRPGQKSPWAR